MEKRREEGEGLCLQVQMFGGFSLSWGGKLVSGSKKTSESQFNYLMQLLLHHRREGVSRDMLERVLFEDRDILDVHHAARSVIYNAKRRLRAAGLPDLNYIEQRKGICYWTAEVPVWEDAAAFEALYEAAGREADPERRLGLYLQACRAYTGEFLPQQAAVFWVAREARRYRNIFCACMEEAVRLLRASQDFPQMRELGNYAMSISPLSDWETVTMEALVAMGRYEDARKLYNDTVDFYFREQGLRPSKRMMELFNKLGAQMEHQYDALDDIQRKLSEGQADCGGGYLCAYPVFQGIYRMVTRMLERGGQSVYLMLCMVVDSKGNPMRDGQMLEELAGRLEEAIRDSVRHSDAISRYGKGQYLVLLMNTTRESCGVIQKRINCRFLIGRQRTGIQYYVNSVICHPHGGSAIVDKGRG
ncbi:BTAD domain-containing putative transcriptional regulator [uncultured Acetatifactor sp.]|uniref:BTAD domain-containing putative transcriptional regulator n=1 Tax=uncultured Acetatifactor sp. TaxID=1671927 RepID=UPI002615D89B|nr:BTAD domain-containing putative transcriptional regulator [uncultured Acetatifactor sp.]